MNEPPRYYYTVKDCFKSKTNVTVFKADSLPRNHILKGSTIWRTISLDNKQNDELLNSNKTCSEVGLFEVIKFGLLEIGLNAFDSDNFNDVAKSRLKPQELVKTLRYTDTSRTVVFGADGSERSEVTINNAYLMNESVKGYLVKEDWVFNSRTGKSEKYIIAFAPLVYNKKLDKTAPLFWLYFAEWKKLLASFEAKNLFSYDVINYLDVFEKRYFVSKISKQENIFDRSIGTTAKGLDNYLESELIKEKLGNFESDLFGY